MVDTKVTLSGMSSMEQMIDNIRFMFHTPSKFFFKDPAALPDQVYAILCGASPFHSPASSRPPSYFRRMYLVRSTG